MAKTALFCIVVLLPMMVSMTMTSMATMQADEQECADQLASLASCIPYVSGTAKKPTPECCEDTKKVKASKPKCLCVLIKESTDPSMGLPINTTLALQMPSACNIVAKASECPALLNLPADSPDAKIFKDATSDSTTSTSTTSSTDSTATPASTASSESSSSTSSTDPETKTNSKTTTSSNNGGVKTTAVSCGGMVVMVLAFASLMLV